MGGPGWHGDASGRHEHRNSRSLVDVKARLQEEFDSLPPEMTDAALQQCTTDLIERARVDDFIPLLAERRTRERLVALALSR
jgi:hypothetical protein